MASKKSVLPQVTSFQKEEVKIEDTQSSQNFEERISSLEEKLKSLIEVLNQNPSVTSNCPKNTEGKREIQLWYGFLPPLKRASGEPEFLRGVYITPLFLYNIY